MDTRVVNSLVLAYLGDAIYEEYIRLYLINKKINKVNDLQQEAVKYVSAKAQAGYLDKLVSIDFFTLEEVEVIKRARNSKSHASPKGCSIIEYKKATALEALLGFLKLSGGEKRILEIMEKIMED